MPRKQFFPAIRIALALVAVFALLWWFGVRMPGENVSASAPLSKADLDLRAELKTDVEKLAGEIGERNMEHYRALNQAAEVIEDSFSRAGLQHRRDSYDLDGRSCYNRSEERRV